MQPNEHELRRWIGFIRDVSPKGSGWSDDTKRVVDLACKYALSGEPVESKDKGPSLPEVVVRVESVERDVEHLWKSLGERLIALEGKGQHLDPGSVPVDERGEG